MMISENDYRDNLNHRFVLEERNSKKSIKVQQRKVLKVFRRYVDKQSRILDAGCNSGVGIQILNKWGYINAEGVEYLPDLVARAQKAGLKVEQGDLHEINTKDGFYDAIFTRYTLEHCHTPSQVMAELVRILKPGGILFVVDALDPDGKTRQSFSTFLTIDDFIKIIPQNLITDEIKIVDTSMGWRDFIYIARKVK